MTTNRITSFLQIDDANVAQAFASPSCRVCSMNKRVSKTKQKPLRTCWVCDKTSRRKMQEHHVILKENDADLTVDVCMGCHWLVGLLAKRLFLRDASKVANLITLARFQAGLPDARTVVKYEET